MSEEGFVNHGSLNQRESRDPYGWVSRRRSLSDEEDRIIMNLKTISTMSCSAWLALARLYKYRQDFVRAEICYIGARYCDYTDDELMREWLGVVCINRATTMTQEELLYESNILNQGMADCLNGPPERVLKELQSLLFALEREEIVAQGESKSDVKVYRGGDGQKNPIVEKAGAR